MAAGASGAHGDSAARAGDGRARARPAPSPQRRPREEVADVAAATARSPPRPPPAAPAWRSPFGVRLLQASTCDDEPPEEGWTRFVCFSDTHGLHGEITQRPRADVVLHAGDFTEKGLLAEVRSFAKWLSAYPAHHKVLIAGNHDVTLDAGHYKKFWSKYHGAKQDSEQAQAALQDFVYLQDEAVEVCGYLIYGSPQQPAYNEMAFNLRRGPPLRRAWAKIPQQVDVLMTHTPPQGILDQCRTGAHVGCEELLQAVWHRQVPVSLFGHVHEGYGTFGEGTTLFMNASTCGPSRGSFRRASNAPIVFDMPPSSQLRAHRAALAGVGGIPVGLPQEAAAKPEDEGSGGPVVGADDELPQ